ncbi:MAG: hypothetical protein WDN03_14165 [Rhizomicrobium sp.]
MWRKLLDILPGALVGWAEYTFRPAVGGYGILNGQTGRRRLFEELTKRFACDAIVETGAYKATTTLYFARFAAKVVTIESASRYFTYSKLRTARVKTIEVLRGESQNVLPAVLRRPELTGKNIFLYLDAHWGGVLPLAAEIRAIAAFDGRSMFLIDDFEVPGDAGYRFDAYGGTESLNLDYLGRIDLDRPLFVYFPRLPSGQETGFLQGYCVGTTCPDVAVLLDGIDMLESSNRRLQRLAGTSAA